MSEESTVIARRDFAKGAVVVGAAALGVAGVSASWNVASAQEEAAPDAAVADVQYGFLMNLDKCQGCGNCVDACRAYNHLSDSTKNRRVVSEYQDERGYDYFLSTSCMHCADPSCMRVCPAGAISKGAAGIVDVDKDRCIGCKYCYEACPYGVPTYNEVAMDKCNCCLDAGVAPGETPYCVKACIFDALHYGPLDELRASGGGVVVEVAEANGPSALIEFPEVK